MIVVRIGSQLPVPGVKYEAIREMFNSQKSLDFFNQLTGGSFESMSIFALNITPYITASIVVQLLQMDLLPKFVEWGKQGEVGRRKLNQATRYISLVLAFVQSIGITATFHTLSQAKLVATPNTKTYLLIGAILTTGSMIVTWLGEQITDKRLR